MESAARSGFLAADALLRGQGRSSRPPGAVIEALRLWLLTTVTGGYTLGLVLS